MRSWPTTSIPPIDPVIFHKPLSLYDSYQRARVLITQNSPSIYVCGITPYDATHLGHAATYISFDLIHRYLRYAHGDTWFIENITDVDDPLLERATRDKQDWRQLATSQIDLFISDMTALRVLSPDSYVGVVESMDRIIALVQKHIDSGLTYSLDGDIYLDLKLVPQLLNRLPMTETEALAIFRERGGDPDRVAKHHPLDPLLWRSSRAGEPSWRAPFGDGRPGWHVECVAIALENLSSLHLNQPTSITIQGGGSDLIFPHHFMTAVQSESLTGKPFASAYVHCGMIGLDGEKMSKSKGNLVFVSHLLRKGVEPVAIRAALMLEHFQSDRMWTQSALAESEELISRLRSSLSREEVAPTASLIQSMVDALSDNLDTPKVFTLLRQWCESTEAGETGGSAGALSRALDGYLGLAL